MTLKGHGNNLETELICLAPHAAPPVQLWESAFQSLRDTCVLVCVIAIGKQDGHVAEVWGASRHRGILLLLCPVSRTKLALLIVLLWLIFGDFETLEPMSSKNERVWRVENSF